MFKSMINPDISGKKILILLVCMLVANLIMAINYDSYEEVEKKELMKVFNDEKIVEQFLEDMKIRKPIVSEEPLPNRNLDTEMVIITSEEFVDDFENFAQLKNEEGIVTKIVSTTTTGLTASQIRNWLTIQKLYFPALTYVLIGGDENIVPIWSFEYIENGESYPATTDFYYSNVLSTWPADNDIMEIELEPDLYVGRVPVRNAYEIFKFYNKYKNYRTNCTENTDRMAFIATNVQKYPGAMADNYCIDQIMDNLDANIETDVLYNYDLVDEVNGCGQPILDMFYDRDYSFLYGMWHAGASQYAIFDSEYDRNNEWFENNFDNHNQCITIINIAVDEGRCWYSDKILSGPHINQYKYYYSRPAENYYQLEDELYTSLGPSYVAWIGACHSGNLETERWSSTIPVQRGIGDTIVMNYDISGERYPYWANSIPDTVYNDENCISEVFFNELGGPIAINTSSTLDYPYFSNRIVEEYFDLQFDNGFSKLGYLTRESWDRVSNWLDTSRVLRELYFGYTLFGDPSMDVWSAEAEQLVTILAHGSIQLGYTFTSLNSSGVEVDAEIVVTSSSGTIMGKGASPYTYSGRIESTSVITSNAPNFIQARNTYSELKDYTGLPYSMTFENGIDYNWEMHSSNNYGRTLVTDQYSPHGGCKHLIMDCDTTGIYVTNEAWLHLDLTDEDRVELNFWWKEFNDETHAIDGVYFSDDGGTNFTKVYSLTEGSSTWQEITLDVDTLSTYYSLDYTSNFVIKFQQYDNCSITNDGFAFDDISVYSVYYDNLPYAIDFNSSLDEYWTTESSNSYGRIHCTSEFLPYEGRGHLTMDSSTAMQFVTNSAMLHLNLSQYNSPEMSFWWKEFNDETHSTDGVYFSDDAGANFTKVHSLCEGSTTWQEIELNITDLASTYNLNLSSHFVIKFQQYDNYPISGYLDRDGFAFDDISIINTGGGTRDGIDDNEIVSTKFLLSNHPNPFNPTTTISFSILEENEIEIIIYNIKGQHIKSLTKNHFQKGNHSIVWNGKDANGKQVSSGVYFYKLITNTKEYQKKMLLMK